MSCMQAQIRVCVICKMNKPPLYSLNFEHRQLVETIVSCAVNITELKECRLLTCLNCQRLIQRVLIFQQNAVNGVRHLLKLQLLGQKKTSSADPLQMEIKNEQKEDSPTGNKPFLEIKVEPEKIETLTEINIDIKDEPDSDSSATLSCGSDVEDETATHTIKEVVVPLQKPQNLTVLPVEAKRVVKIVPLPHKLAPALDACESRTATFTHQRPAGARARGRGAAAAGRGVITIGRGAHKINNPSLVTLLQTAAKVPRTLPEPSSASSSTMSTDKPADTDKSADKPANMSSNTDQAQTQKGCRPWYIRVLKEEEVSAELQAARGGQPFLGAPHRCRPCARALASAAALAAHRRLHLASAGPYACNICTQRVRSLQELSEHRAQHAVRYCCCCCGHSTPDRQAAERHSCDLSQLQWEKTTFTKYHVDGHPRTPRHPKTVKCKECFAGFANDATLAVHTAKYHAGPDEPATCNVCGKVFKNKLVLNKHAYTHKRKNLLDSRRPERLSCSECKLSFETEGGYRQHRLSLRHSSKDTWKHECDYCGKKCQNKSAIRIHILLVHCKEREFKCDKCPKSFITRLRLQKHAQAHAPGPRPRPHVCERCGKAFTERTILAEHLNIHEGVRPHACPLCPATFTFKAALYTHNRLKHLKIKREWKKKPKKGKEVKKDEIKDEVASPRKVI